MCRIEPYTDKARKKDSYFAEWELKLSDGIDVRDKLANFLD